MLALPSLRIRSYETAHEFERRETERLDCRLDATTGLVDAHDTLSWGASVRDVSQNGLGLTICFPFRAGTFLAIGLYGNNPSAPPLTVLSRVVQVRDQDDGTWRLGCEFVKPLSEHELESLLEVSVRDSDRERPLESRL